MLHSNQHQKYELCWQFLYILIESSYPSLLCYFADLPLFMKFYKFNICGSDQAFLFQASCKKWNFWVYLYIFSSFHLHQFSLESFPKAVYLVDVVTFSVYRCTNLEVWLEVSEMILEISSSSVHCSYSNWTRKLTDEQKLQINSDSEGS